MSRTHNAARPSVETLKEEREREWESWTDGVFSIQVLTLPLERKETKADER